MPIITKPILAAPARRRRDARLPDAFYDCLDAEIKMRIVPV
jgi:hypothetical protein